MCREIVENREIDCRVLAFLDDDPAKHGRSLHGVAVVGPVDDLRQLLQSSPVDEALIAIPSATGEQMRRIVDICRACEVKFKTLPGLWEIIDGRVSVKSVREVSYEDLLGRPQVRLDCASIAGYLAGKVVAVTGGGGSIGSELCRQIVGFGPSRLVIVDNGEANLHHIQMELQHERGFHACVPVLSRVQDKMLDKVFERYKPEVVFHAAAYKHVPMMEWSPWEAVFNNVLGSMNAMNTAKRHRVRRFVLVSTDKAVRPTNVMGTSKRIAELLLQSMDPGDTKFMAVRFGNVLGSSGSVIPLFRKQIEQGGPVTVTHPAVTRYFMSIPEAAKLILQAGALGTGGEVFLLKMGTPIRILDMALDLIRLSGKRPYHDIDVSFTGLRPGEKLFEELITGGEGNVATQHDKIIVLKPEDGFRLTNPDFRAGLERRIKELMAAAFAFDGAGVRRKMREIVPEYAIPTDGAATSLLHTESFAFPNLELPLLPSATSISPRP
jgi:FlaA1/EpsC-like NDP-sugar epimerase